MPVGTSFENSAMKTCFSLSSLPASDLTPEKSAVTPRLYSSLTKNRVKATALRRSWGSTTASEHREEFWAALQSNYDYIMDNQLIDKCQEANNDLKSEKELWSLKKFYTQFSDLYLWLNSVQETFYGKEENITDKVRRANYASAVRQKSSLLTLFNDQASQLVELYPKVQEEVGWRVAHLNTKWETILTILGPSECEHCEQDSCLDLDREIKYLKKWFKIKESRLEPLDFHARFTRIEKENKLSELKVLHRDIQSHRKIVGSVVKLCERPDASCNTANIRRIANGLDRRWQQLCLRSLEWQYYLESYSEKENKKSSTSSDETDSDCYEEPVNKTRRLSSKESYCTRDNANPQPLKNECSCHKSSDTFVPSVDVMNDSALNQIKDPVDGNLCRFQEDTSQFTKSNRTAPNLGTYYFRHEDTDCDMERQSVISKSEIHSTVEETSEEEWTYTKNESIDNTSSKSVSEEVIRKLVHEAEDLVNGEKSRKPDRVNTINKMTRVKKWLSIEKPEDSCDASGEDDERESQISEDLDESTTTYLAVRSHNSQNTSFLELNHTESPHKVHLRQRKYNVRPWSVSCISQLNHSSPNKAIEDEYLNFSISESALHNLVSTPKNFNRLNANSANSIKASGNTTSSALEESHVSPNRKRRTKFKKKPFGGKVELGLQNMFTCPKTRNLLIKSGSFSGCSSKQTYMDRHTSSDPSTIECYPQSKYEASTTSGADSEEDKRMPFFKLGSKTHYLIANQRDSSPGKSSLNMQEEQSSLSEQAAWDSYQEKYLSEAYSETHDSDGARKLLEFGEDYRNFLDSQSDYSTNPDFSPKFRRRSLKALPYTTSDSDARSDIETESIRQLLNNSRRDLTQTQLFWNQHNASSDNNLVDEYDELISTCDRHINLLNDVEKHSDDLALSKTDKGTISELLTQWGNLRNNFIKMQEHVSLQNKIQDIRNSLQIFETPEVSCRINLSSIDELPAEVDFCEKRLKEIDDFKKKLLTLNVAVNGFSVANKDSGLTPMKTGITELYHIWKKIWTSTTERLALLQPLLQQWKMLDNRLDQLHVDLRSDEKTLHLLDTALQGGTFSDQMASYVRDVAKLLSETVTVQGCKIPELFTEGGSLSDSGISDEGSEHEIGERERRLAAIRRLVRQFEGALAPDCKARLKMTERLNAAEEELKALQKRCRTLIVDTAGRSSDEQRDVEIRSQDPDYDDPSEPSSSWFKRVVKASVPFQVVIITLLCIACLLEPQCCDNMNNFAMSLSPQLRYINGPPPI